MLCLSGFELYSRWVPLNYSFGWIWAIWTLLYCVENLLKSSKFKILIFLPVLIN